MVVVRTPSGEMMSVRTPRSGDVIVGGGGGSQGMSTRATPTPSASELFGSAQQREQQIQAFRSGGRQAFERLKQQQQATENQRKRQEANRIESERKRNLFLANKKYQQDLKKIHNQKVRGIRSNQLQQQIADIQANAKIQRVERGIVDKSFISSTKGEVIVTSANVRQVRQNLGLTRSSTPKSSTTISKTKPGDFEFIKLPLKNRLTSFIRNKIPGGRTIVRKLKDASITLKDIEKRFPVVKDFLSANEKKRRKMLSEGFVVETKDLFPKISKGTRTDVETFRPATFTEKLGVKKDKDTVSLKLQVELIQSQLVLNKITEKEADAQLDTALGKFMVKKAKKRIPQNIALGMAFTAIQAIPIIGQAVTAGFVGAAVLNRRQIVSQFKNFPKASAIDTASFIVGGLVGSVIKGSVKGRINKNIDPKQLKSVSNVVGNEKIKAINQAKQLDNGLRVSIKQKKITGLSVYDVLMKDGRKYRVVEFNKLSPRDLAKGLQGEKGLIGMQLLKARGEKFFGRGVSVVTKGKTQTFLRILRFKPAKSPIGRAIQKFGFNKGKIIDVLEKSKVITKKGKVTGILSKAKILSIKKINRKLRREINFFEKRIKSGKKIGITNFKKLINLERRANGLKPFTKAEFKKAKFPTITQTLVLKVLKNAKLVFQKNANLIRASAKLKMGVIGISRTRPGKISVKVKRVKGKKTPLSVTFKEVSPTKFQTKLQSLVRKTRRATNQQLRTISKQVKVMKTKLTGSPGAVTLALAVNLDRSIKLSVVPGAVVGVTIRSIWEGVGNVLSNDDINFYSRIKNGRLSPEQRWMVKRIPQTKIKIRTKLKLLQKVKQKSKTKLKNKQRIEGITRKKLVSRQIQGLKQLQKIGQKLKQKQKVVSGSIGKGIGITGLSTIPTKKIPLIPFKLPKGFKKKKLKKGQQTFFVKIKRKGKIVNLTPRPLLLRDARDFLAYQLDHNLIRSGWFEPMGKNKIIVIPSKSMKGYFNKIKRKLRAFKIKVGKKKKIRNGFIERTKFILDKKKEKGQLKAARKRGRRKSKKKLRRSIRKGSQKRNGKRKIKRRLVRRRKVIRRRRIVKKKVIRLKKKIRKGNKKRVVKRKRIFRRRKSKKKNIKRKKRK